MSDGGAFTYEKLRDLWGRLAVDHEVYRPSRRPPMLADLTPGPPPAPLGEIPVTTDWNLPQWEMTRRQIRFPRSKRRRIRRKWEKSARNWRTVIAQPPKRLVYKIGGTLWMHPETWEVVKRGLGV